MDKIRSLFEEFVDALDRRDDSAWLSLFAEDGYYAVVRRTEYDQRNNFVLIGEDMKRMKARFASGQELDKRKTSHFLGVIHSDNQGRSATARFSLCYDGRQTYAGEYRLELDGRETARIKRCTVILDNELITDPIYRPI